MTYVELHARSAFSFLEGASLPEEMAAACAAVDMPAMALIDCNGVYGAPRFHLAAEKTKIRSHFGADILCETEFGPVRVPLLVTNQVGYQNLCRLISRMKLRVPRKSEGITTYDELAQFANGLICLTGEDQGPLALALANGALPEAKRTLEQLAFIFGRNNLFVELQRHHRREQESRNQTAVSLARSLSLPLLATNGVRYVQPAARQVLDVFTCLRNHRTLATAGRLLSRNSECCLKSGAEMARLFADLPEAITNTAELSSRLEFKLNELGYQFPPYPVPDGDDMNSFLRKRAADGEITRYGQRDAAFRERAHKQIERELLLIEKLGLAGYFLIVWDIVRFCRSERILVQGRGSAANSAVCYSLGITAVDPVGMELLFERFLSEERGEWPDIDLDLPSGEQRERAIQYVYKRYGKLGAAMTANVITYRGRSAAREVGKVLGFDAETLNRLSPLVNSWEYKDEADTMERHFNDAGCDTSHPRIRKFLQLCMALQDLPRHLGQHSGGLVVCQGRLDSVVPLEPASMPDRVVVQWDKEDCADMKIVKVDLLGLGMMAVLEDTISVIHDQYRESVDLAQLPADDPTVYSVLQKADTIGMFQIESRAQMSCLPRLRPERFYDLVVQVAIIRPGPIVGQMVNPFLERRLGREKVTYPHPSLEPVLKRTLGVPLFQEQLLRVAMIAANFSGGEAEELRRAMGFKRSEKRMREIEVKLRRGMQQNGISPEAQEQIIQSITSFALYGFPESHAASFALLAYASAWLKCHYLGAFTASLLNNQPMGFYHPATIVKDAQRHGLRVRPIDVLHSDWKCTLEPDNGQFALRIGMRYARGMRQEAAEALVAARTMRPFASIDELARRVPELRKTELVTLGEIGALNALGGATVHRRDALWQVERAVRNSGPLLREVPDEQDASPLSRMTAEERLVADFSGTGMTVGPHPMRYHREQMNRMGVSPASQLAHLPNGKLVRAAGSVIVRQRPGTAKGFVFLSLEDETGVANAIIHPDLYQKNRVILVSERFLLVEGILQNLDNVISVKANRILPLHITQAETTSHDFH
jgi:error-prone DNA polymerase